ncbi:MAG TPA: hypothetical protein PKI93_08120 [Alphaproteobacteria bacterium]|nr:hypothetical protein [Alphaproteobacteria bacterium]HNS44276.1 hypothetical protein [Alphaproteobacteria bacterium]
MAAGSFDFRSFQKYFTPQASDDLNRFLEKVPQNAGQGALVAAGISWAMVAALGLFTVMQLQQLTDLRAKLLESEALKPAVPVVSLQPVAVKQIKDFSENFKTIYPGMVVNANAGAISIQSKQTSDYGKFREAVGHVVNGGVGWHVSVETFCVGRECKQNSLDAKLKIESLKIDKPSS